MSVDGHYYLSIKINGKSLPSMVDTIQRVEIVNSALGVPSMKLTINDKSGLFTGPMSLVDGTKITLTRGRTKATARTTTFSVVGARSRENGDSDTRVVVCILDVPGFFTDMPAFAKRGTSISVAQALADKYGLKFTTNITGADDNMRWTTFGVSPRQFLELLERRMWAGEKCHPQTAVTEDKELIINDLVAVLDTEPVAKFTHNYNEEGAFIVLEKRTKSLSGVMNMQVNYGATTVATNSKGEVERYDSAAVKTGGQPNINAKEREAITGTQYHSESNMPMSDGPAANVHKNWVKAFDVWRRNYSLFTEYLRLRVDTTLFGIKPLSCVEFFSGHITPNGPILDKKLSGKWVYYGYTEVLTPTYYQTAALLCRNFTGSTGSTELISSTAGKNKAAARQPSVADNVRPPQQNDLVRQAADGESAIDSLVKQQSAAVDSLMESFTEASSALDVSWISEKYGAGCDKLDALMSEFSAATFTNKMCGMLSPLEKLSLDFSLKNPGSILQMLDGRLGAIEDLMGVFTGGINGLIKNGDIPASYIDLPTINASCANNVTSEMTDAIQDKLGNKCMNAFSLDKLHGPSIDLSSLYKKYEEYMRKFLCAFGKSNGFDVDAS